MNKKTLIAFLVFGTIVFVIGLIVIITSIDISSETLGFKIGPKVKNLTLGNWISTVNKTGYIIGMIMISIGLLVNLISTMLYAFKKD